MDPIITSWHWAAFAVFLIAVLALDLLVLHRNAHAPSVRESAGWTVGWTLLALAFNGLIWWWLGSRAGGEFLVGYLVEWSLSMDNVFVFAVIFSFFQVPLKFQYRVLFWGILGAVILRLAFILLGAALVERFQWVMVFFALFLIFTAFKLAFSRGEKPHPENNRLVRLARRMFPVAKHDHGDKFFVVEFGRRCITPLFLVLLVIESTDVVFAVDSVPAIFGVVDNHAHYFRFVVFTSNVFAILGLRALYFLLAGVMNTFRYLDLGLSAVLGFIGVKMLAEYVYHTFGHGEHHLVPPWASLAVIVALLGTSIVASLIASNREKRLAPPPGVADAESANASPDAAAATSGN